MHVRITMEWSNDLIIQLIKEYKNKRELWDWTCDSYRMASIKFEAWQDLASMFDCEIIDVKRKMNSLLASHRRERAKIAQGVASNWFAMPYMKFLKGRHNRDEEANDDDDQIEMAEESIAQQSDSEMSEHNISNIKIEHIQTMKPKTHRQRLVRTKHADRLISIPRTAGHGSGTNTNTLSNSNKLLVQAIRSIQREKKKDECDIFGEYIANALRKHDQRTRAMIKHAMNNILFESEMKKYNVTTNYQHVEINLTEETNPLIIPDQNGEVIPIEESIMEETHEDLSAQKLETIDNSYTH